MDNGLVQLKPRSVDSKEINPDLAAIDKIAKVYGLTVR